MSKIGEFDSLPESFKDSLSGPLAQYAQYYADRALEASGPYARDPESGYQAGAEAVWGEAYGEALERAQAAAQQFWAEYCRAHIEGLLPPDVAAELALVAVSAVDPDMELESIIHGAWEAQHAAG